MALHFSRLVATPAFYWQFDLGYVFFNGTYFVYTSNYTSGPNPNKNIWASTDLIDWSVVGALNGAIDSASTDGINVFNNPPIFNGRVVAVDSAATNNAFLATGSIYDSSDGINFSLVHHDDDVFYRARGTCVFGSYFFVWSDDNTFTGTKPVYRSVDLVNWTRVSDLPYHFYTPGSFGKVLALSDRLVYLVTNKSFESLDNGASWFETTPAFVPTVGSYTTLPEGASVYNDAIWVKPWYNSGGTYNNQIWKFKNRVWTSEVFDYSPSGSAHSSQNSGFIVNGNWIHVDNWASTILDVAFQSNGIWSAPFPVESSQPPAGAGSIGSVSHAGVTGWVDHRSRFHAFQRSSFSHGAALFPGYLIPSAAGFAPGVPGKFSHARILAYHRSEREAIQFHKKVQEANP